MYVRSWKIWIAPIPNCKCHGVPKKWCSDRTKKSGGTYRCIVKRRMSQSRYNTKRYAKNQIYRTTDVIRKKRKRRKDSIARGEEQLRKFESTRGVSFETVD